MKSSLRNLMVEFYASSLLRKAFQLYENMHKPGQDRAFLVNAGDMFDILFASSALLRPSVLADALEVQSTLPGEDHDLWNEYLAHYDSLDRCFSLYERDKLLGEDELKKLTDEEMESVLYSFFQNFDEVSIRRVMKDLRSDS